MAGVKLDIIGAEIATTTSLRTIIQAVAAANHRVLLKEWSISFKGIVNTDAPILVELVRQSTAGTSDALTPVKGNISDDETLQTTARETFTSTEPTSTDVLFSELVHPQTGYTWQAPFGGEIPIGGGKRIGLRVTAGVSRNCVARFKCEE